MARFEKPTKKSKFKEGQRVITSTGSRGIIVRSRLAGESRKFPSRNRYVLRGDNGRYTVQFDDGDRMTFDEGSLRSE